MYYVRTRTFSFQFAYIIMSHHMRTKCVSTCRIKCHIAHEMRNSAGAEAKSTKITSIRNVYACGYFAGYPCWWDMVPEMITNVKHNAHRIPNMFSRTLNIRELYYGYVQYITHTGEVLGNSEHTPMNSREQQNARNRKLHPSPSSDTQNIRYDPMEFRSKARWNAIKYK